MTLFQHATFETKRLSGKRILDLGCGRQKFAGAIGVDIIDLPGVDVVANINERLPFNEESFDVINAKQVFEHIPNLIGLMGECHRVLTPGGLVLAQVPYFRSSWAAIDPTHVRQFTINSLHYFVRGTYEHERYRFSDVAFSAIECILDDEEAIGPLRYVFSRLALRWPYRFENSVLTFLYPFQSLTFVLTK